MCWMLKEDVNDEWPSSEWLKLITNSNFNVICCITHQHLMDGNPIKFQRGLCFHDKKHLVTAGNAH